jgi:hypothetical protein
MMAEKAGLLAKYRANRTDLSSLALVKTLLGPKMAKVSQIALPIPIS